MLPYRYTKIFGLASVSFDLFNVLNGLFSRELQKCINLNTVLPQFSLGLNTEDVFW